LLFVGCDPDSECAVVGFGVALEREASARRLLDADFAKSHERFFAGGGSTALGNEKSKEAVRMF